MKCHLKNTCARKHWCCNFCALKCNVRCKDNHENCKWFIDGPIEEVDDKGNVRFFKYIKNQNGEWVRHYYSLAELQDELARKRKARDEKNKCKQH